MTFVTLPFSVLERHEGRLLLSATAATGGHLLVLLDLALERRGARVPVEVLPCVLALVGPVAALKALLATDRLRRRRAVDDEETFEL